METPTKTNIVPIEIFTRAGCARCEAVLDYLQGASHAPLHINVVDAESAVGLAGLAWLELVNRAETQGLPVVWIPAQEMALAGDAALEFFGLVGAIQESPSPTVPEMTCTDNACSLSPSPLAPLPEGEGKDVGAHGVRP